MAHAEAGSGGRVLKELYGSLFPPSYRPLPAFLEQISVLAVGEGRPYS